MELTPLDYFFIALIIGFVVTTLAIMGLVLWDVRRRK